MSGHRVDHSKLTNQPAVLSFTFDGQNYAGLAGDTVASALLANGVRIFGRSFKYHRPRGVWGAWFDDPNATMDIRIGGTTHPNCQATTTYLENGMEVRSVNAWPNAKRDVKGVLDFAHRFLPAGFYYKMFMWPDWHLFEPTIRKMAGLGALSDEVPEDYQAVVMHDHCETLVIGGGLAGATAARAAAQAGQSVLLIDDHAQSESYSDGAHSTSVLEQITAMKAAGGRFLERTTALGVYDHKSITLVTRSNLAIAPVVRKLRPNRVILATGAIDRPVTFVNNDRPGVMSLGAGRELLNRYGVLVGRRIAILSNRTDTDQIASGLETAGAKVELFGTAKDTKVIGLKEVIGLKVGGQSHSCDTVLASAGLTPVIHLWRHAGGKLDWNDDIQSFVPAAGPEWMRAVGGANGTFDPAAIIEEAEAAGRNHAAPSRRTNAISPMVPDPSQRGRQWIDFQHDVTLKDVALAHRENMISVEHLKRYTTLGMAGDQGKTSNIAGLSAMAELRGKSIPEVGTTTFRPPFVPVQLEAYCGAKRDRQMTPLKRLALEFEHRALDAAMGEYGGWLRPAWYGGDDETAAVVRECHIARNAAAVMDGSALGAIEVIGPDAREFVNFVYYNTMSNLKPGRIRYGFMLSEAGLVFDDGVMACVDDNRFIISCSSSHADAVMAHLENWRQDRFDPSRVHIHDTTMNWSTVTVAGPKAREIISKLGVLESLDDFPHMSLKFGTFNDGPARVSRVSFTGDTSFEISVPNTAVRDLWRETIAIGAPLGAAPVGAEALTILRAEKGYILVGKDTDGETMPHDLGFAAPRLRKTAAFVGDRSLHSQKANLSDRKQLVGLAVAAKDGPLPIGAHIIETQGGKRRSLGYVTSSHHSPTLQSPIALALVSGGADAQDKTVTVWHMGKTREATIRSSCAFDPEGGRIDA